MQFILDPTDTAAPAVKVIMAKKSFYMHSRHHPLKEARRWVNGLQIKSKNIPACFVLVGMGGGYQAQVLQQEFPDVPMHIWDFNNDYYHWLLDTGLLDWLQQSNKKITYQSTESLAEIRDVFLPLLQKQDSMLLIHPPSLEIIPACLTAFKALLTDRLLLMRSTRVQGQIFNENYRVNLQLNDPGINKWLGQYQDQSMVLVAAGPSLTKQLPLLREIQKNVIIASVGTALTPLVQAGIKPHLVMLSDPGAAIIDQINKVACNAIPLFYLCTANAKAIASYSGPRYIVWQQGFSEAEQQAATRQEPLIQTGGSVATCLLDLMVQMGGNPIALVGQDLAYTNGRSHASGTHAGQNVLPQTASLQVPDFYQKKRVPTAQNLASYLRWLERYVSNKSPRRFYNCTEGGAYINGWLHTTLADFVAKSK